MFRVKSKPLLFLLVLIFSFGIILGCSSEENTSGTGSEGAESGDEGTQDEVTEVTFWHNWETGPAGESIQQSVAAFNESRSDIEVNPVYVSADGGDSVTSQLVTAVAGGNPPDVMLASRYGVAEYMDSLTLLNDLAERDGITEDLFYDWAWGESTYEDRLLGLPYDATARALYYNKDHFEEAGLDPDNPPTTIDELEDAARQLTVRDGDRISRYGFVPMMNEGWLYTWGWSFGGQFVDDSNQVTANDPKVVEALEWMTDFPVEEYGPQNTLSFTSSEGSAAQNPFISGQLSMVVTGNWMLSQIEEYGPDLNYGITHIPTPTGDNFTTFLGGRVLIIPRGVEGEQQEAAWEFIKWMTTEEGQEFKEITGEYAAIPEINDEIYGDDPQHEVFLDVLPDGYHRPVILAGNMMWDELARAPELVIDGQGTPQEILDEINERIKNEIEQEQERSE